MRVNIKRNNELIKKIENKDLNMIFRRIHARVCSRMNSKNLELEVIIPKDLQEIMNKVVSYYLIDCQVLDYYENGSALYGLQFYDYNKFVTNIYEEYGVDNK